jgi:hypothetical protein
MATPTEQAADLARPAGHLGQPAPPVPPFAETALEERKFIVRDILQSFLVYTLPSHFRPEAFERITEEQGQRRSSEWTLHDDLPATFLTWACHDEMCWTMMNRILPAWIRPLLFQQKLVRNFNQLWEEYDALVGEERHESAEALHARVAEICHRCREIVQEAADDLATRTGPQYHATEFLLVALLNVCRRNDDLLLARPQGPVFEAGVGHHPGTVPTLFRGLIDDAQTPFMLETLEMLHRTRPESFTSAEVHGLMGEIRELLVANGAPRAYLIRYCTWLLPL